MSLQCDNCGYFYVFIKSWFMSRIAVFCLPITSEWHKTRDCELHAICTEAEMWTSRWCCEDEEFYFQLFRTSTIKSEEFLFLCSACEDVKFKYSLFMRNENQNEQKALKRRWRWKQITGIYFDCWIMWGGEWNYSVLILWSYELLSSVSMKNKQ